MEGGVQSLEGGGGVALVGVRWGGGWEWMWVGGWMCRDIGMIISLPSNRQSRYGIAGQHKPL